MSEECKLDPADEKFLEESESDSDQATDVSFFPSESSTGSFCHEDEVNSPSPVNAEEILQRSASYKRRNKSVKRPVPGTSAGTKKAKMTKRKVREETDEESESEEGPECPGTKPHCCTCTCFKKKIKRRRSTRKRRTCK
ncbi:Hypothetical predicted protein [Cloeon dipterum]|uniref:Uncharacterized protein n=1 Tax=Cloeon dipterum TaxID=197152 RepID=A0A8S1BNR6_9INSE|nr:Hypothetical predicted protein [Cloeon dipterum]